jgi:hypothetical protein
MTNSAIVMLWDTLAKQLTFSFVNHSLTTRSAGSFCETTRFSPLTAGTEGFSVSQQHDRLWLLEVFFIIAF